MCRVRTCALTRAEVTRGERSVKNFAGFDRPRKGAVGSTCNYTRATRHNNYTRHVRVRAALERERTPQQHMTTDHNAVPSDKRTPRRRRLHGARDVTYRRRTLACVIIVRVIRPYAIIIIENQLFKFFILQIHKDNYYLGI